MSQDNVIAFNKPDQIEDPLTELLRTGAQKLIQQAVDAELRALIATYTEADGEGRAAVVRNGYLPEREILTGVGPVSVKVPKIRSRGEEPVVFRLSRVPPYVRRAKTLDAALPWLYLKGIATGQMSEALEVLVGPDAKGLSAPVVSRLKKTWSAEYEAWCESRFDRDRWVYVWADGIYSGLRADTQKPCALVVIGVNERGERRFLAIEDGIRFVVTNLPVSRASVQHLYEKLYCVRGEMDNRIKQQLGLFADRTSTQVMRVNQLRLYFPSFAYVLMHGLRRLGLEGTQYAKAQCTTIRVKLLKIGARLRITARKVWLSFSEAYPYVDDFAQILANLHRYPAWAPPG